MTLLGRAPGSSLHLRLALTLTTCASTPCRLKVLCSICGVGVEKNSSPDIIKKEGQNLSTEHRNRFFPSWYVYRCAYFTPSSMTQAFPLLVTVKWASMLLGSWSRTDMEHRTGSGRWAWGRAEWRGGIVQRPVSARDSFCFTVCNNFF